MEIEACRSTSTRTAAGARQRGDVPCCSHLVAQVARAGTVQPHAPPHRLASQAERRFPGLEFFLLLLAPIRWCIYLVFWIFKSPPHPHFLGLFTCASSYEAATGMLNCPDIASYVFFFSTKRFTITVATFQISSSCYLRHQSQNVSLLNLARN